MSSPEPLSWIIESESTTHIILDGSLFDVPTLTSDSSVKIKTKQIVAAVGQDNVMLNLRGDSLFVKCKVQNVLHVLSSKCSSIIRQHAGS